MYKIAFCWSAKFVDKVGGKSLLSQLRIRMSRSSRYSHKYCEAEMCKELNKRTKQLVSSECDPCRRNWARTRKRDPVAETLRRAQNATSVQKTRSKRLMAMVHACSMAIVHARTMATVRACILAIVRMCKGLRTSPRPSPTLPPPHPQHKKAP